MVDENLDIEYSTIQELSEDDLENSVRLPYIIKDKILMSPGVWNSYYYSSDAINNAFIGTDWSSKENRSLFLDHIDDRSSEWIGEVLNVRKNGDDVIGDLVIIDKPTAIKLHYGAKMGISPKVHGPADGSAMQSFVFDNFSVVINPAVKTAWINNSQKIIDLDELGEFMDVYKSLMEAEDMTEILSKYTDFVKKFIKSHPDLPIQDAIKEAAKEWKKQKGGKKMAEDEIIEPQEPQVEEELAKKKKKEEEEMKKKKEEEEELAKKKYKYPEEAKCNELSDIKSLLEQLMTEVQELKKKYPYKYKKMDEDENEVEEEMKKKKKEEEEEMAKKKKEYPYPEEVKKMSEEIVQLKEEIRKLNEPSKVSIKQELNHSDVDMDMLNFLKTV